MTRLSQGFDINLTCFDGMLQATKLAAFKLPAPASQADKQLLDSLKTLPPNEAPFNQILTNKKRRQKKKGDKRKQSKTHP